MEAALKRRTAAVAPPPTPIATGKGLRSAAVNDRVLTAYLENSLRVPSLSLPSIKSSPIKNSNRTIHLPSLIAGDDVAVEGMMKSAAEIGAFWIDGGDLERRDDVRWVIEVWEKEEMGKDGYRIFREKLETVTSKLEFVAESITKIFLEHVGTQSNCSKTNKAHSVLSLRKYDNAHLIRTDTDKHHNSHALSIHISGNDYKFGIRCPSSNSFILPSGSILVTIGLQFEDLCNGKIRSFNGEIFIEPGDDQLTHFSLELTHSMPCLRMPCLNRSDHSSTRTFTVLDQLLVLLALVFFYNILI